MANLSQETGPQDPLLTYDNGSGLAPSRDKGNYTRSGNRIVVLFGGHIVGLVQSVQLADDYGVQPANRLGSLESVELVPLEANHTINVSLMMLSRDGLYKTGAGKATKSEVLIPHSGVNSDTTNTNKSAIAGKELEIVVHAINKDGTLGDPLVWYHRCVYSSGNVDVTNNRLTVSNATFRAVHRDGDFFDGSAEDTRLLQAGSN